MKKGRKHSDEAIKKIRMASIGRKHSESSKQKMSFINRGINNPMYGKNHSKKTCEQIGKIRKEKYFGKNHPMYGKKNKWGQHTLETKQKMSKHNLQYPRRYWLGKHLYQETIEKISFAKKGTKLSEGHKIKLKENAKINLNYGMKGKKHSEETKLKLAMINKGKKMSEETKIKIHNALKGRKNTLGKKYPIELYPNLGSRSMVFPKKDTSIEIKIQNFLKQLNIDFFTHQYMNIKHRYRCDIFIPSKNLVIETDGNYWHCYPTGREIDNIRTKELIDSGFKVLRLWEIDIKKMELNEFKEKIDAI